MKNFYFWQRYLFIVRLMVIVFGVFMALFNRTVVFNVFNNQIHLDY